MKGRKVINSLVVFLILIFVAGCKGFQGKQSLTAEKGTLDLNNWNFSADGPLRLDGEWRFYWNKLIEPSASNNEKEQNYAIVKVPGIWDTYVIHNKRLDQYGYATYELRLKMKKTTENLEIMIPHISSAYKLWVDNELIAANGEVGMKIKDNVPSPMSKEAFFHPKGRETTILLQVTNFKYRKSGIIDSIYLGTTEQIKRIGYLKIAKELFFCGAVFIIGIYNLIIYKKIKSARYFGIGCVGIAIRNVFYGEYFILYIFPKLHWLTVLRIEYLSYYVTFTVFMVYIYYMLPKEFQKGFLEVTSMFGIVFSLIVLTTPPHVFTKTLIIFQAFSIAYMVYVLFGLMRAVKQKRKNAIYTILGSFIFIAAAINDILYNSKVINTIELSSLGSFIFICFQAVMISRSYVEAEKKAQAYEGEKEKHKLSEIMRNITSTLNSTLDLDNVINIILEQLKLLVSYDYAVLLLLNEDMVRVSALKNFENEEDILNKEFYLDHIPMMKKIIKSRNGVVIKNLKYSQEPMRFLGNEDIASWIGVPIFQEGEVIGALSIQSMEENKYTEKDKDIIAGFAAQVAAAIRNARLYTEVKELAMYDGLTGVLNRRTFFEIAEKEYKRAERYKLPLSIIMIDIDYFKSINDKYGHGIGDKTLRTFASEMKGMLRETDIIGRYGGEEFIILTNVSKENGEILAERLRKRIEGLEILTEEYGSFSITASFGVAELTEKTQDLYDILSSVDKALYDAKNSGRNKVMSK